MPWHQFLSGEGLLGSALCEEKSCMAKGEQRANQGAFRRTLSQDSSLQHSFLRSVQPRDFPGGSHPVKTTSPTPPS